MVTEGLSIGNIADMIVIKQRQLRWIELHVDAGKLKLEFNWKGSSLKNKKIADWLWHKDDVIMKMVYDYLTG
jgi:hypothetical protein